jgi:hypothetical protein
LDCNSIAYSFLTMRDAFAASARPFSTMTIRRGGGPSRWMAAGSWSCGRPTAKSGSMARPAMGCRKHASDDRRSDAATEIFHFLTYPNPDAREPRTLAFELARRRHGGRADDRF